MKKVRKERDWGWKMRGETDGLVEQKQTGSFEFDLCLWASVSLLPPLVMRVNCGVTVRVSLGRGSMSLICTDCSMSTRSRLCSQWDLTVLPVIQQYVYLLMLNMLRSCTKHNISMHSAVIHLIIYFSHINVNVLLNVAQYCIIEVIVNNHKYIVKMICCRYEISIHIIFQVSNNFLFVLHTAPLPSPTVGWLPWRAHR